MMISILPILLWLSLHDLRFHRIPNTSIAALSITALLISLFNPHSWSKQLILSALVCLLALIAYLLLGLGMGDVKLLTVLALLVIPAETESLRIFLTIFSISVLIQMLISTRPKLHREIKIPLGPAISIATVVALLS
jgi:Flp pilus assembly protein protease CpaA